MTAITTRATAMRADQIMMLTAEMIVDQIATRTGEMPTAETPMGQIVTLTAETLDKIVMLTVEMPTAEMPTAEMPADKIVTHATEMPAGKSAMRTAGTTAETPSAMLTAETSRLSTASWMDTMR